MHIERIVAVLVIAGLSASVWASAPIGTLKSDGRFEIRAAGDEQATRFDQAEYTFFSGDTVAAKSGPVVLNLSDGGGLGVTQGSEVSVTIDAEGAVRTQLIRGSVLYAFPEERVAFSIRAGNFEATGSADQVRALQVSRGSGSVGTIELLEDGNIHAAVREGALFITNGSALRYRVDAGESVGLLDLPGRTIKTQAAVRSGNPAPPILMQSPEQVNAGEEFVLRWEAFDPVSGDFVVIAEEGAPPDEFEAVISSDEGTELRFEAPGAEGDYEIRFIDGETGEIKRFVHLHVVEGIVPVYWWQNPGIGVLAGAVAVYIGSQVIDDDDPQPASP